MSSPSYPMLCYLLMLPEAFLTEITLNVNEKCKRKKKKSASLHPCCCLEHGCKGWNANIHFQLQENTWRTVTQQERRYMEAWGFQSCSVQGALGHLPSFRAPASFRRKREKQTAVLSELSIFGLFCDAHLTDSNWHRRMSAQAEGQGCLGRRGRAGRGRRWLMGGLTHSRWTSAWWDVLDPRSKTRWGTQVLSRNKLQAFPPQRVLYVSPQTLINIGMIY